MSAAVVGLQQVIFLDEDMRGVLLPAARNEIVGSTREGNSLVLQLADGRTMLIVDMFLQENAVLLVRGEFGGVSALEISRNGEIVELKPVSLTELEEMFGAGQDRAIVEVEPEPVEVVEEAPEVEEEAPDEAEGEGRGFLGELTGLLAAGAGLAISGGGEDEEEDAGPSEQFQPIAEEVNDFGFTAAQWAKIQAVMETVMEPGFAVPGGPSVTKDTSGATLRVELDANGDSTADALRILTFDNDYNIKRVEFDDAYEGGDFVAERTVEFRVDSTDSAVKVYDDDANGTADRAERVVVDASGAQVTLYDDDYDGILFWANRAERIVDSNQPELSGAVTVEIYEGLDGSVEGAARRVETRVSDSGGRLVEVWVDSRIDGNLDGSVDVKIVHHYGVLGQRIRSDIDYFGDGTVERSEFNFEGDVRVDRVETYAWDSRGRLERIVYDDDNDETADWSASLVYVPGAGPSVGERSAPEAGVTASPQDSATERGATRLVVDANGDGVPDRSELYSYVNRGFALGRLREVVYDDDNSGDGTNERRVEFVYDEDNAEQERPQYAYTDLSDDGTFERAVKYSYEDGANGLLKKAEYDDDYDGTAFQADRAETMYHNGLDQVVRVELDDDADGTADRVAHYAYGRDGRIAEARLDEGADGTLDRVERHRWNPKGQRAGRIYDDDYNGASFVADRIENYEYDASSRLSGILLDSDADGTFDSSTATTYNARGQTEMIRRDYDHDGVADRVDLYAYDGKGRLTSLVLQYDTDDDGNGNFERVETLLYDNGILTERQSQHDADEDGTANQREWHSYDEDGTLSGTRFVYDADEDGTSNREEVNVYESGSLVSRTIIWDDFDDGTANRQEDTSYGADDLATTSVQVFDLDGNGVWDRMVRTSYVDGLQTHLHVDENYDGIPENFEADQSAIYEYDEDDILIKVRYDGNADGTLDRVETYLERDALGRLTVIEHDGIPDSDGDGSPEALPDGTTDRTETRTYSSGGWLEMSVFEFNDAGGGSVDRMQTLVYDQSGMVTSAVFDGFYGGDPVSRTGQNGVSQDSEAPDGTPDLREDYTWHAPGLQQTKTITFYGADGSAAVVESETYDTQGRVIQVTYDGIGDARWRGGESEPLEWWLVDAAVEAADGTHNRLERSAYDPVTGELSRRTTFYDDDQDGNYNREERSDFSADGSYIRTFRWDDAEGAAGDDGIWDRSEARHFNANGDLSQILHDRDGDGSSDASEVRSYDAQGRHVKTVTTEYEGGTVEVLAVTETLDADSGRTRSKVRDIGADGTDDWREDYVYDGQGNLTRHTIIEHDDSGTSAVSVETRSFHANGSLDTISIDVGDDGTVNIMERFSYIGARLDDSTREYYSDDGTTVASIETRSYDSLSRVTREVYDLDNDGTVDLTVTSSYGAETSREFHIRDRDDNGTVDHAEVRLYDSDNRLLRVEVDENYDGTSVNFDADRIEVREYASDRFYVRYDLDGNGTAERTYVHLSGGPRMQIVEVDDTGDGIPDLIERRSFDFYDRITRIEYYDDGIAVSLDGYDRVTEHEYTDSDQLVDAARFDDNGDGSFDRRETYDYRPSGRIRTIGFDDGNDGVVDRYVHWHYNSKDLISRIDRDANGDGMVDSRELRRYDGMDRIERVIYAYDRNSDGSFDRGERELTATYAYSPFNQIERIEYDTDGDGTADEAEERIYDAYRRLSRINYNLDGVIGTDRTDVLAYEGNSERLVSRTIEWNSEGDAAAEIVERRSYDALGRVARVEYYDDGDATDAEGYDRTSTYTYLGAGRLVATAEFDVDGNGVRDWWATYTYGLGNRIERIEVERDVTGNGTADELETHHYAFRNPEDVFIEYDGVSRESLENLFSYLTFSDAERDGTIDLTQRITYSRVIGYTELPEEADVQTSPGEEGSEIGALPEIARVESNQVEKIETDFGYDQTASYSYGTDGQLERAEVAQITDNAIERIGVYSSFNYDADFTYSSGTLDRIEFDTDENGTNDRTYVYSYNASGGALSTITINFDTNEDGTVDDTNDWNFTYDGTTGELTAVWDNNFTSWNTYNYDADGTLTHVDVDLDIDDTADRIDTYNFSGAILTSVDIDKNADGTTDQKDTYRYDDEGNLVGIDVNVNLRGADSDRIDTFYYSDTGDLVRADADWYNNGTVDLRQHYVGDRNRIDWIEANPVDENSDGTVDYFDDVYLSSSISVAPPESDRQYGRLRIYNEVHEVYTDTVAHAFDEDNDGTLDSLRVVADSGFSLDLTEEMAAWMPNIGGIYLHENLDSEYVDGFVDTITDLRLTDEALRVLASVDGTVDESYTLYIHGDEGTTDEGGVLIPRDTVSLTGDFTRDAGQDETVSSEEYHAYVSGFGAVLLVDADIAVSISSA